MILNAVEDKEETQTIIKAISQTLDTDVDIMTVKNLPADLIKCKTETHTK